MNEFKKAVAKLRDHLESDRGGLLLLNNVTRLANESRQQVAQLREQAEQAVQSKTEAVAALRAAEIEIDRLKAEQRRERDLRLQHERDAALQVKEAEESWRQPQSLADVSQRLFPHDGVTLPPLPPPTAALTLTDLREMRSWSVDMLRGILQNPIYCGLAAYPALVSTNLWIHANCKAIRKEGPEQFLVNLIHLLKTTFGTVEKDDGYPNFYDEDDSADA